jgi:hypothetical protein
MISGGLQMTGSNIEMLVRVFVILSVVWVLLFGAKNFENVFLKNVGSYATKIKTKKAIENFKAMKLSGIEPLDASDRDSMTKSYTTENSAVDTKLLAHFRNKIYQH